MGTVLVVALAGVLAAPGVAQAGVTFDRAFGLGVDSGSSSAFENCTGGSGCQTGSANASAGGVGQAGGVAVDPQGRILAADLSFHRIGRFPVAGDGTVGFDRHFGVDVDGADGNTGDFESCSVGCQTGTATGVAGGMSLPGGVAVDSQGRILVGDIGNNRVDRFTVASDGTVSFDRAFGIGVDTGGPAFENCTAASICQAGTASGAAGGMDGPFGVAVDSQGRILVADQGNDRVDRFTVAANGVVSFDRAFGIDVDPSGGNAGDFENCTAASTCQAGTASGAAGGMDAPSGVAVDAQGRISVADQTNNRVDRFTVAGNGAVSFDRAFGRGVDTGGPAFQNCSAASTCQAGTASGLAGGMDDPTGVGVDAQGHILVASQAAHRVDRFSVAAGGAVSFDRAFGVDVDPSDGTTGDFENCIAIDGCQPGTPSGDAGGMKDPVAVSFDRQGRILVADFNNLRVDRFSPGPTVTVTNVLTPAGDAGRFDLRVDAVVVRAAAANGQSGSFQVADGVDVTISEQAAAGQLSDYNSTIDCGGGPQPGTSLTVTNVTANVNCTITNTRKAAAPGPGGPGPQLVPAATDSTRPALVLAKLATRPRLAAFRKGVSFTVKPSEAVTLDVTLTAKPRRVTLAAPGVVLAEIESRLTSTAARRLKVKPRARLLGKPKKAFKAVLRIVATDKAGNRTTTRRTITVRPDRKKRKKR